MARAYQLLCPVARALDHLGDRWTLLILRDLHAGPARFSDLEAGLPGIAANLLSPRLRELQADGLIRRSQTEHGIPVYELTDFGRETQPLLFELGKIGARFGEPTDHRDPAHLRSLAPGLVGVLRAADDSEVDATIELRVDDQPFEIELRNGEPSVRYRRAVHPDLTLSTSYRFLLDVMAGDVDLETDLSTGVEVVSGDARLAQGFATILRTGIVNTSAPAQV